MKACHTIAVLFIPVFLLYTGASTAQQNAMNPVTPNASPEARALLKFFYSISGRYILTGQHNFPNVKGRIPNLQPNTSAKHRSSIAPTGDLRWTAIATPIWQDRIS